MIMAKLTFITSEKLGKYLTDLIPILKIQKTEVSLKENESHDVLLWKIKGKVLSYSELVGGKILEIRKYMLICTKF